MAVSNIALWFVLICAVCAVNARGIHTQQYPLQSLNRAVEAAKAMYETLVEEQARAPYYLYPNAAANMQQESFPDERQSNQEAFVEQSLNRAMEAAMAMYETLAKEQARAQYGLQADNEEGPFEPPVSQQGGGWVTDQQALEAERDPNQPNDLYLQFAAPLADGGPG